MKRHAKKGEDCGMKCKQAVLIWIGIILLVNVLFCFIPKFAEASKLEDIMPDSKDPCRTIMIESLEISYRSAANASLDEFKLFEPILGEDFDLIYEKFLQSITGEVYPEGLIDVDIDDLIIDDHLYNQFHLNYPMHSPTVKEDHLYSCLLLMLQLL